jgi:2-amino-4-hydroxy-6-hydroxymethyldihydropteridine diphosphokinase
MMADRALLNPVALSLGSNLGDRCNNIALMEERLRAILESPVRVSSLMETEPLEVATLQPAYLNRMVCGGFKGDAEELLKLCQSIENDLGRTDKGRKLARTADIDIILFGNMQIQSEILSIPHPQLFSRRFCIEGLCEIVPEWSVPGTGFTIMELYDTIRFAVKGQKIERVTV